MENLNDKEIRKILIKWLSEHDEVVFVREEMPSGATRFDVTAFQSKLITGFEIKSDRDILDRLSYQLKEYESICDYCYVVVGEKYEEKILPHLPYDWGILLVKDNSVIMTRKPTQMFRHNKERMLHLCWKNEIYEHIKHLGVKRSQYKHRMVEVGAEYLGIDEIRDMVIKYACKRRISN